MLRKLVNEHYYGCRYPYKSKNNKTDYKSIKQPVGVTNQDLYELVETFVQNPVSYKSYTTSVKNHNILRCWSRLSIYSSSYVLTKFVAGLLSNTELPKALGSNFEDVATVALYGNRFFAGDPEVFSAVAGNPSTPLSFIWNMLKNPQRSTKTAIYKAVASNPSITKDICRKLMEYRSSAVRLELVQNPVIPTDVLKRLSKSKNKEISRIAKQRLANKEVNNID